MSPHEKIESTFSKELSKILNTDQDNIKKHAQIKKVFNECVTEINNFFEGVINDAEQAAFEAGDMGRPENH